MSAHHKLNNRDKFDNFDVDIEYLFQEEENPKSVRETETREVYNSKVIVKEMQNGTTDVVKRGKTQSSCGKKDDTNDALDAEKNACEEVVIERSTAASIKVPMEVN